jgi:flagellar protein FliL
VAAALVRWHFAAGPFTRADGRNKAMAPKPKRADIEEAQAKAAGEADEETEDPSAPSKRKFPLKLIIIAAAAVAVLGSGGTAAYLTFGGAKETKAAAMPAKPAVFIDVPEVLVNLSSSGSDRAQYLKIKIVLEVADAALTPQIQTTMPRVLDAFQTYLRELRPTDLDGSAGLYRLKEELTRRVNLAIAPSRINAVLFKEIVVQ